MGYGWVREDQMMGGGSTHYRPYHRVMSEV